MPKMSFKIYRQDLKLTGEGLILFKFEDLKVTEEGLVLFKLEV